ncbi:hypothetical protein AX15_000143 [Amanita polypyramis BW_CC]|nr:hypothetical protein AX15_000143 [Amanita polypyramis BW_CC]
MHDILPDYSPSTPAPAYSFEPSFGEQRLQLTPRHGRYHPPLTTSILRRLKKATLVLHGQETDAKIPSYGRNDEISGALCFDDPANITDVTIKVRGAIETTATELGTKTRRQLDNTYNLWKRDATHILCPSQLPFSYLLSSIFMDDDREKHLPPSFHFFIPGFYVKVHYWIIIEIARMGHWKVDLWPSVQRHSIPFNYSPRSRPGRPIVDTCCFLSGIKSLPEEWYQATAPLQTRLLRQPREPLYCHFFVPSSRIYGLSDTIPFHIQLNGPISSLQQFFPPDALHRITSADSAISNPPIPLKDKTNSKKKASKEHRSYVRVILIRQVAITCDGGKAWQNSNIGEGVIYPLPPPPIRDVCLGAREESLDWNGHIRCNKDVTSGSFATSLVQAQHFLSLVFTPPEPRTFVELTINIPIKFVSDSYSESDQL